MEKLKVIIADDHPIVLLGVRELVERDPRFSVVGEAVCSQGLIELLERQPVDMVISDYNMPADSPYGDGLKLIDYLKRHYPAVRILVLTMISNPLILTRHPIVEDDVGIYAGATVLGRITIGKGSTIGGECGGIR
ncbi:response regulator, partial [Pseudomonas sp. BEA3.1]|uniref:response regulator n=1 Tax=Pseudomonas sp. BEA3.1 TaxID=3083251 RepID=UPI0029643F8D